MLIGKMKKWIAICIHIRDFYVEFFYLFWFCYLLEKKNNNNCVATTSTTTDSSANSNHPTDSAATGYATIATTTCCAGKLSLSVCFVFNEIWKFYWVLKCWCIHKNIWTFYFYFDFYFDFDWKIIFFEFWMKVLLIMHHCLSSLCSL